MPASGQAITTQKLLAGGAHGGLLGVALAGTLHGAVAGVEPLGRRLLAKLTGEADRLGMRAAEGRDGRACACRRGGTQGLPAGEDYVTRRERTSWHRDRGEDGETNQKGFADEQTLASLTPTDEGRGRSSTRGRLSSVSPRWT